MYKWSGLILPIFMSRQQLTNSSKPFLYGGGRQTQNTHRIRTMKTLTSVEQGCSDN